MSQRTAIRILLIAIAVFGFFFVKSMLTRRAANQLQTCQNTLMAIEGFKEQYAIDHDGVAPADFSQLIPGYLPALPVCPAGGTYTLGNLQTGVTCSIVGHVVNW